MLIATVPFVLVVNPSLPVNSVTELVRARQEQARRAELASAGVGALHHIYMPNCS